MQYRVNKKNGDNLSILGFGCMRLPKDPAEQEKQIIYAIENGVNYFDTAYIYRGSEAALGRVLAKGYRQRVKIATKLPHYLVGKYEDLDKIFNNQLRRLQTDWVDYYLIHMLNDADIWQRLLDMGILAWIAEKKAAGQIINLGFSYHGGKDEFVRLIDAYSWEFCMIQYNYLDEHRQAGRSGLEYAAAKGVPVMIMEPLRGGRLVFSLPRKVHDIWASADIKRSPAEWALRFVWNHPAVNVVLSGMNSMEMLQENLLVADTAQADAFTPQELSLFEQVRQILNEQIKVPCTGCNYCMPCPYGVDIPTCFSCYNDLHMYGKRRGRVSYLMQTTMKTNSFNASLCQKCGRCEKHCPQNIAIRQELSAVTSTLEGFYYKPARFLLKKFMKL